MAQDSYDVIIVGSGAIGMEFASFYNDLGCKVTIIEVQNNNNEKTNIDIVNFFLSKTSCFTLLYFFS